MTILKDLRPGSRKTVSDLSRELLISRQHLYRYIKKGAIVRDGKGGWRIADGYVFKTRYIGYLEKE